MHDVHTSTRAKKYSEIFEGDLLPLINQDCSCYRLISRLAPECVDKMLDLLRKYEDTYPDLTAIRDALRALLRICQELKINNYQQYDHEFLDIRNKRVKELKEAKDDVRDGFDIFNLYFANLAWYAGEIAKCPFVVDIPEEIEDLISKLIQIADSAQGVEFRDTMVVDPITLKDIKSPQVHAPIIDDFKRVNVYVADESTWPIDCVKKFDATCRRPLKMSPIKKL